MAEKDIFSEVYVEETNDEDLLDIEPIKSSSTNESISSSKAAPSIDGGGQVTPGKFTFTAKDEIELLKEVILGEPWNCTFGDVGKTWKKIADSCGKKFVPETGRKHFLKMMLYFKKKDSKNLKRSGTVEEVDEKTQLLQDIKDLQDNKSTKRGMKAKIEDESKEKGEAIRNAAMTGLCGRKTNESPSEPVEKKKKLDLFGIMEKKLEIDNKKVDMEKEQIEIRKRELALQERRQAMDEERFKMMFEELKSKK